MNIKERLDILRKTIQEEDFFLGKGLSNEVNIRMFCYDPKDEMEVRDFTDRLSKEILRYKVDIVDLYEVFLSICEDQGILEFIPTMEEEDGKEFLAQQLEQLIDANVFADKIMADFSDNILLITGVGKVFPFMRIHALLNALQYKSNNVPIVVLYPGTFDGHYVKLFNKLKANEYYRAFNII